MLEAASVTRHEARIAVNTNIGSTIRRYPLAISVLSKPQCKEIAKAMLNAALQETGVVRNADSNYVCNTRDGRPRI